MQKSPPDSRMTGADSPVMALSSTEAAPSMTSPSAGMVSSRLDQHDVAFPQIFRLDERRFAAARTILVNVLAMTIWRMLRSAEACARLRPSASASAKLANSTVKSSQTVMAKMNPAGASPWPASAWP